MQDANIGELAAAIREVHEHVPRVQGRVRHAVVVQVLERAQHLLGADRDELLAEGAVLVEQVPQRHALDVLCGSVHVLADVRDVEHPRDVLVAQRPQERADAAQAPHVAQRHAARVVVLDHDLCLCLCARPAPRAPLQPAPERILLCVRERRLRLRLGRDLAARLAIAAAGAAPRGSQSRALRRDHEAAHANARRAVRLLRRGRCWRQCCRRGVARRALRVHVPRRCIALQQQRLCLLLALAPPLVVAHPRRVQRRRQRCRTLLPSQCPVVLHHPLRIVLSCVRTRSSWCCRHNSLFCFPFFICLFLLLLLFLLFFLLFLLLLLFLLFGIHGRRCCLAICLVLNETLRSGRGSDGAADILGV